VRIAQTSGATTVTITPNESAAFRPSIRVISGSLRVEVGWSWSELPSELGVPRAHEELKEMGRHALVPFFVEFRLVEGCATVLNGCLPFAERPRRVVRALFLAGLWVSPTRTQAAGRRLAGACRAR
jgi:hypothetical protein